MVPDILPIEAVFNLTVNASLDINQQAEFTAKTNLILETDSDVNQGINFEVER